MKLVLCSEGFATPNTVQACVDLCDKPHMNAVAENLLGDVDIINLLALSAKEIRERFADKDVIFAVGGHADYLMYVYQKSGFNRLLPELLKVKVYVGSSAGAMVMGRRLPGSVYQQLYGEESRHGVEHYLDIVDFSIMPHLDSLEYPHTRETLVKALGNFTGRVYGLRDDSAVIVHDQEVRLIGSEPAIIN